MRWDDAICPGCGRPVTETFDPELQGAYEAHVITCHACAAREKAVKADEAKNPGVRIGVDLRPEARRFLSERSAGG